MANLPQTRQSLLLRLQNSSSEAWPEFLEIYEKAIYWFARGRGLQDADAWDVTQEVLAAVDKKIGSWDHDSSKGKFRGWLFRVARNIAVDRVVELSKKAAASGDTVVAQLLNEFPEDQLEQSSVFQMEYRRSLLTWAGEQIKSDFNENSWKSFLLTSVEGRKPEDVAKELNMTPGSVYAAKFRIVSRIKKLVEQFDDQSTDHEAMLRKIGNDLTPDDQ